MIPVYRKKPGAIEPQGTHYIAASNGLFLRKRTGWVDAVVPVFEPMDEIDDEHELESQEPSATLVLPALPAEIMAKALALFKAVFDVSQSEACLLLHHGEKGYELSAPKQQVSPWGLDYDATGRLPGTICVGTIHSHGVFPAGHSPTDIEDEEDSDGVHITIGTLDEFPFFSLSAEMAVSGQRFPVDQAWFQGVSKKDVLFQIDSTHVELKDLPAEWLGAIQHVDKSIHQKR